MAAWSREEASENRQRKRKAGNADKLEVGPGVALKAALIGPTQRLLPRRRRLRR